MYAPRGAFCDIYSTSHRRYDCKCHDSNRFIVQATRHLVVFDTFSIMNSLNIICKILGAIHLCHFTKQEE
jgi:hypothetical protein